MPGLHHFLRYERIWCLVVCLILQISCISKIEVFPTVGTCIYVVGEYLDLHIHKCTLVLWQSKILRLILRVIHKYHVHAYSIYLSITNAAIFGQQKMMANALRKHTLLIIIHHLKCPHSFIFTIFLSWCKQGGPQIVFMDTWTSFSLACNIWCLMTPLISHRWSSSWGASRAYVESTTVLYHRVISL